ncbi:hypothetical protein AAFC00_006438 [Neodothiora populina]|uniref:Uncharacterized protein n=1 Tax=Neodothiora populina TaxID=2781224 RepID=A0ABR3P5A2_9PEZI
MLPHPDLDVLSANPQFAALYSDLQKNRLHGNGASKLRDLKELKKSNEFQKALHEVRVREAKNAILRDSLRVVAFEQGVVPEELQQVMQIVSAQLDGNVNDADGEIIDGEIEYFMEEIDTIAPVIGDHLQRNVELISTAAGLHHPIPRSFRGGAKTDCHLDPSDPPNDLLEHTTNLKIALDTNRAALSASRIELGTQISSLLIIHTRLYETLIRVLEQVIHGKVARHTRAKAAYLAVVAEGMEKKFAVLKAQVVSQVYDKQTQQVLIHKMDEVQDEGRRVVNILRRREAMLEELESKGRGLEKVVEDVKAVKEEIAKVREEVERLESGR